ncbi:nucleotide exchange factor GrpE [Thermoactinomyces mirandus]|uniref:Protein GrpE n=1 Tax=Thermoactinomyces mirandus TaxID=2756294 RepID=A0A7W2AQQ8_9BACL|nr:nucleotide exchange factor GrpE [Thermoactinomyces mirandus]MBA4600771.1 nucleotide exchange factor GrpE [Thermoactinomyces mirandus]
MDQEKDELQHTSTQASPDEPESEGQGKLHSQEEQMKAESVEDEITAKLQKEAEEAKLAAENWKKQAEQNREQYLRALADFENYRRRARKDKEDALKYGVVPLLESLLPVLDNFERALDAADFSQDAQLLQEGIEMVYRQFLNVLSQAGLTMIETEGKPFNPHEHNAVAQVEAEDVESGIVVEELQAGYRFLDRVIRPSMVKVSK